MAKTNRLSVVIPPETETEVLGHIQGIKGSLPWLLSLNSDERLKLVKLGYRYVEFVDKALIRAQTDGNYLTNESTLEEFTKDVVLKNSLNRIYAEWLSLGESIKDTILVAESEAYQSARLYYKSVKAYASEGDPVAEQIEKELAKYHKKKIPVVEEPAGEVVEEPAA